MKKINKSYCLKSQRGSTLIVALVMLGVMAILTAATITSSTLQERMANNARQRLIANAAAESALREAEQWLGAQVNSSTKLVNHFLESPTAGCYADRELPSLARVVNRRLADSIVDISDDEVWLANQSTSRSVKDISQSWQDGDWARTPRVVIELLGAIRAGMDGGSVGNAQNMDAETRPSPLGPWVFRVTAIGWSKNPDIYSVLQSTYTTGKQFGM